MGRPIVISSSATSPRQSLSGNAGGSEASPANNTGDGSRRELDAELQVLRDSRRSLRDAAAIGNGQQPAMQQRRPQEGQMRTQPSSHAAVLTAAGALTSDAPASDGTAANHSNGHGQSSSSSSSDAPPDLSEAEVLARVAFLKEVFVQWDKGWDEQALRNLARVMRAKTFGAYETVVRQDGHAETVCITFLHTRTVRQLPSRGAARQSDQRPSARYECSIAPRAPLRRTQRFSPPC